MGLLVAGLAAGIILGYLAVRISYFKRYELILSYRNSTQKELFDIEGLSKDVGDGLSTVAVFVVISSVFLYLAWMIWFLIAVIVVVFISSIIVIGKSKFMPARQLLKAESPHDERHYLLYRILPESMFRKIEAGTRQWKQVCSKCAHTQDFWEAGGVRYKAVGEPFVLGYCEARDAMHMHRVRRKDTR